MEQDKNTVAGVAVNTAADTGFSKTSYLMAGTIIAIILIVAVTFAMSESEVGMNEDMGTSMEMTMPAQGTPAEVAASEASTVAATTALTTQGTSDELDSIDADLKATNLGSLGDPSQI